MVWDDKNRTEIVLLTNHLKFGSTTISSVYRERWQIDVFFKALKQNLKVKTFIGVSEKALRIQIWTALVAMVEIKWLHYRLKAGWSFSNMAVILRLNLFTYRDLDEWLNEPYATPTFITEPEQLRLALQKFGQPVKFQGAKENGDQFSNLSNMTSKNVAVTGSSFLFPFILDRCETPPKAIGEARRVAKKRFLPSCYFNHRIKYLKILSLSGLETLRSSFQW